MLVKKVWPRAIYCYLGIVAGISFMLINPANIARSLCRRFATMAETQYNAGTFSVVYVSVPDNDVAKKLSWGIIEQNLGACVKIVPGITSVYRWEGKVEESSEILLMIKTRTSAIDSLSNFVRKNHPYSVVEIISLPIEKGNPAYLEWVAQSVPENPTSKAS